MDRLTPEREAEIRGWLQSKPWTVEMSWDVLSEIDALRAELDALLEDKRRHVKALCFASADLTTAILESSDESDAAYWMGRISVVRAALDAARKESE